MKTKSQAESEARGVVSDWAAGAALTGWIPGSSFFLAAADTVMIRQVADAFGVGVFDMNVVVAHLGGIVASAIGGSIASEVLGLIPVFGWLAKSAGMAAKAAIIGEATIEYFREVSPLPN
jgi:uncharacterized protein (DUF697 family)